jgi:hypothetical protein
VNPALWISGAALTVLIACSDSTADDKGPLGCREIEPTPTCADRWSCQSERAFPGLPVQAPFMKIDGKQCSALGMLDDGRSGWCCS